MLVNVASDTIGILHVCGGDPMQDIPNNLKTGILHACGGDPLRD